MKNNLSIVIATLNEEGNIQELYNEIDNNLKKIDITWEIIFVDDDSSDRTVDIINQLRDKYDNVFLIKGMADSFANKPTSSLNLSIFITCFLELIFEITTVNSPLIGVLNSFILPTSPL